MCGSDVRAQRNEDTMKYRVEKKFLVTDADIAVIAGKLSPLMSLDAHQKGKSYELRSLYFDDIWDTGLEEKDAPRG